MKIINLWADLTNIADPPLRRLLEQRHKQLAGLGEPAGIYIVEPGDTLADIEKAAGFPIATNLADGAIFPDPDFVPSWEWVQTHEGWREIVYILSDDDGGTVLLVPRHDDIDPTLHAILRAFALEDGNTGCTDPAI